VTVDAAKTPGVSRAARVRAHLVGAIVSAGICGVGYRAWGLQVEETDRYRALAERQHEMRVAIPAPRGDIVDSRGRPLAISADTDSVWANPHDIHDVTATAAALAGLLDIDDAVLEAKLGSEHRFVWLARHVTPEIAQRVHDAKLPGIELAREPRRWYPARTIGGPIVGRADIDGKGVDGVELALDPLLTGRTGATEALRDARGHTMLAGDPKAAEPGAKVTLTIDRSVQAIADDALAESVVANKAKSGVAVVLDVRTSRVLAMASFPTADPNVDAKVARNRVVADAYEAGSVMKVFSIAAALDDGTVSPTTEFDLGGGVLYVGKKPIHDVHADRYLTVGGIIKRSSNVGAAKIALLFGRDKLYAALQRFGFGTRTGVELPGEQAGVLHDGAKWRDVELATIAYGYGLTVTPLQIAAALAAIGNDGIYQAPRIVEDVVDADGSVLYVPRPERRPVVSPKTAAEVRAMLASVFDKGEHGGTAKDIDVVGFVCGGKTGTAHKYDPETRQYAQDRYLSSFAGLAPIDNPRLAIVVMVDEPMGGDYYGGKVAGPVFATIASQALRYLGVPGVGVSVGVGVGGSASAPPATPAAHAADSPTPTPTPTPTFVGLGMTRALDLARSLHLTVKVHGTGRVIEQKITEGAVALTLAE
jgi:cell division protein FtsI (penicillin-binding protein 3)